MRLEWSLRMAGMALFTACVGVDGLWLADPMWWQDGWFEACWLADIVVARQIYRAVLIHYRPLVGSMRYRGSISGGS